MNYSNFCYSHSSKPRHFTARIGRNVLPMLTNRFVTACSHALTNAHVRIISKLSDAPTTNSVSTKISPIFTAHTLGTITNEQTQRIATDRLLMVIPIRNTTVVTALFPDIIGYSFTK